MWKYGRTLRKTSSRRTGTAAKNCCWFAVRFACVSITPLGKPVVPLVYGRAARSSMPTDTERSPDSAGRASKRSKPTAPEARRSAARRGRRGEPVGPSVGLRVAEDAVAQDERGLRGDLAGDVSETVLQGDFAVCEDRRARRGDDHGIPPRQRERRAGIL